MKDNETKNEGKSRWRIVRSIDRRQLLAVAVALMCLTALPGASSAAGGGDVRMSSNHTDFGTGDEPAPEVLENFSVGGSGDSALLSGPVGGTTKGGGLVSSGDTISWSESSPSTSDSVINVTGVLNSEWSNISNPGVSAGETNSIDIGGSSDPVGPSTNNNPVLTVTGQKGEETANLSQTNVRTGLVGEYEGTLIKAEYSVTDPPKTIDSFSFGTGAYSGGQPTGSTEIRIVEESPDGQYEEGTVVQTIDLSTVSYNTVNSYDVNPYSVSENADEITIELVTTQVSDGQYRHQSAYFEGVNKGLASGATSLSVSGNDGTSVSFGDLSVGESKTAEFDTSTSTTELNFSATEAFISYDLNLKERSKTVDPVVELNGDSSQQISVDGSVAGGQTVTKEIDNSWLESGENTARVTLNDSGLDADDPPMEAKVSVEKPAQSARYVSAAYDNLSRSNGVGVDWSGSGTLDVTVQGWTGSSWEDARQLSTSETGDVILDYEPIEYDQTRVEIVANDNVEIREESIQFFTSTPEIESATPSSGDAVSESPVELSIDISDADFGTTQGDSVDVTFYDASDDSEIGTDTLTQNGTATASWSNITGGANEWYAVASDSYGNSVTSQTFTFNAPSELEIRALDTQELITTDANGDPINVEVQFFGDDGAVAQRNTTDGTISLTGLPVDERFSVSVDAGDTYVDRRILITSLIDQQTAYLLNASDTQLVRPRFTLEDPSNQFDTEESEIILERPIETANGTRFVAVTGDRIGLNGFDTTLEEGQRYRVIVRDPESGSVRRLGEYTPTASEPVTLTVQDVEFDSVSEVNGLEWGASYTSVESGSDEIQFVYRDSQDTVELEYEIYERGNETNVLASGDANGNVTVTESVPPSEGGTVWTVEWSATRADGETLSASRVVSSNELPVGDFLPEEWQTAFSVVTLFVIAGLFGGVNPGVGGIAVASTGGFFFLLGWLPGRTTGLMVLLAMFIAVLSYGARQARGATA